ncbi:hypothetical protein Ahy_B04g072274 isoform C [Arachis hypogaea]|uniref:Plant heme peroxidase family profile domain-containing protein n=1 Tax=Arachis hypogaea TaxID=3818 RepID=A0A444ZMS8_ARAHY|nr:hypothetical protein Ahy_B04g072274 isoform C [Arachis hypogaea]
MNYYDSISLATSNKSLKRRGFCSKFSNEKQKKSAEAGAHTIGVSHCSTISNCLYNFTGKLDQDPALDSESMHKI